LRHEVAFGTTVQPSTTVSAAAGLAAAAPRTSRNSGTTPVAIKSRERRGVRAMSASRSTFDRPRT
jgi:hypothetical protein